MPTLSQVLHDMKPVLKIDWATHEAAKYACENWHYSRCMPAGKLVKVGAWENGKFIGVVIFGRGATPNLGKPYGLAQLQCVELTRIALTKHITPVSRIMAIALRLLAANSPGLRLVVSFADRDQMHHGGIYQATNWVYSGTGDAATFYLINGKKTHPRSIGAAGHVQNLQGARKMDRNAKAIKCQGKHRYLMPLDAEMKKQILPLARPYPKRADSMGGHASGFQPEEGGSTPTSALQSPTP